jgi:hypothetical protein
MSGRWIRTRDDGFEGQAAERDGGCTAISPGDGLMRAVTAALGVDVRARGWLASRADGNGLRRRGGGRGWAVAAGGGGGGWVVVGSALHGGI